MGSARSRKPEDESCQSPKYRNRWIETIWSTVTASASFTMVLRLMQKILLRNAETLTSPLGT